MDLGYPYGFDRSGRTATTDEERHVRDLIEQVLFTAPGERVMRPDFGAGAAQLVFAPNAVELAAATQLLVQGALQKWLADRVSVLGVQVEALEEQLRITVEYALRRDGRVVTEMFSRTAGAPS